MQATAQDSKAIKAIIAEFQNGDFPRMSGKDIIAVATACAQLADLDSRINADLKQTTADAFAGGVVKPIETPPKPPVPKKPTLKTVPKKRAPVKTTRKAPVKKK